MEIKSVIIKTVVFFNGDEYDISSSDITQSIKELNQDLPFEDLEEAIEVIKEHFEA